MSAVYVLPILSGFLALVIGIQVDTNAGSFVGHQYVATVPVGKVGVQFLGIPYGESTGGERRFTKPTMKSKLIQTFNASEYGPSCPQNDWFLKGLTTSEDCLSLNIFTSEDAINGNKKAVIVWIHGGGFSAGNSEFADPRNMAAFGDVIIVSVNYRLDIFGFLSTEESTLPGNYGLWDQHLAIRWVNNNIDRFGGDKDNVSLFGISAGAGSVTYQAMYKGNKGLFKRIIAVGGTLYSRMAYGKSPKTKAVEFGKRLDCDTTSENLLKCLREKSVDELLNAITKMKSTTDDRLFVPSIDGDFIDYNPGILYEEIKAGKSRYWPDVELLLGINQYDGSIVKDFLPSGVYTEGTSKNYFESIVDEIALRTTDDTLGRAVFETLISCKYTDHGDSSKMEATKNLLRVLTDFYFTVPAMKTVLNYKSESNKKVFLYLYSHTSYFQLLPFHGARHMDSYLYLFGFSDAAKLFTNGTAINLSAVPKRELDISKAMMEYWTNFAKSGNPNIPETGNTPATWPEYTTNNQEYLEFGEEYTDIKPKDHLYAGRMAFWMKMVPTMKSHIAKQCPVSSARKLFRIEMFTLVSGLLAAILTWIKY